MAPKKGEEAGRQKSARSSSPRSGRPAAPAAPAPKGAAPAKAAPQTSAPVSKEASPFSQAALKTVEPSPEADEPYVYPDGRTYPADGVSLCCLKPNYFPRSWAIALINAPFFDSLVLLVITVNTCSMAWESPLDEEGTWKSGIIAVLEAVFLWVYTVEMFLKMLAYGVIGNKRAYMHDPWCVLDFIVVSCAWAPILLANVALPNMNSLRALRAFRALRAMKIIPGLKLIIDSMLDVIPKLGNVTALFIFIFVVFGTIGMELFEGLLHYRCAYAGFEPGVSDEADFDSEVACNPKAPASDFCGEGETCAYFESLPFYGMMSFDSVPLAMVTLLSATTWDTWETSMFCLMDITGNWWCLLYYLGIIILGGCFARNLFLAVLFEEFTQLGRVNVAVEKMEKRAAELKGEIEVKEEKVVPTGFLADLANSSFLSGASILLVLVNMVLMCMPYYGMSDEYAANLELVGSYITYAFAFEMGIKLLGLGCGGYWSDGWNCLDGTIVLMSLSEILVTQMLSSLADGSVPQMSFLRMLRLLRVARALRLMRSWQGLYSVVATLLRVAPKISSLFCVTFVIMLVFTLAGMEFFGGIYTEDAGYSEVPCPGAVCPNPDLAEKPYYANFDYFYSGMLSVFILFTGEWVDSSLAAASVLGPKVLFYFIPCMCIGSFLVMNIFIGMVLSAFGEEDEEEEGEEKPAPEETPAPAAPHSDLREEMPWPQEHSLCLFGPRNILRRACEGIVSNKLFEHFILLIILASSYSLAIDTPLLDPESVTAALLTLSNYIFTAIFVAEMLLKIIAYGFAFTERAYLKDSWNQLDFFIVVVSVTVIAAEVLDIPALAPLTSLRVLRALRPLRLIGRIESMKVIVSTLIRSIPAVVNVGLVYFFIQSVFAILGMQLFAGTFAMCQEDPTIKGKHHCEDQGYLWANPPGNAFDDFGQASLTLFLQTSGDLWETEMFQAMAASAPGHIPVRNDFSPAALFSIAWMFFGAFIALNLFVGAIVETFNAISAETGAGSAIMTGSQLQWVQTIKVAVQTKPTKGVVAPSGGLRLWVFNLVMSISFDAFIIVIILLNTVLMASKYYQFEEDGWPKTYYDYGMRFFTTVYYVECALKMFAMGPGGYFSVGWNRFDFTIVCTAALDDLSVDVSAFLPISPFLLRVLRIVRIVRILRILKGVKGLRDLVTTVILSAPPVFNVCQLLVIVMFIFSVLGMSLFGNMVLQDNVEAHANFQTVPNGMLLLLQTVTGDGWTLLLQDTKVQESSGLCTEAEGNCGTWAAIPYFVTFQLVGTLVFLNLMIAVILDNFTSLSEQNPDLVSPTDVDGFMDAWAELDPEASNTLLSARLPELIMKVPPPLGVMGDGDEADATALAKKLKVDGKDGVVKFADVLLALSLKRYLDKSDLTESDLIKLEKDVELQLTKAPAEEFTA